MGQVLVPPKLKKGDHIRAIAPSRSYSFIPQDQRSLSRERFEQMGLRVSFGAHIEETDEFVSTSIESRLLDLHAAFSDSSVNGISTVIGGFNSNQLLKYIDYGLIRQNPKVLCGYSDITALQNAIFAKTGLVTYSGPHYSTFAIKKRIEFTMDHFKKCVFEEGPFELKPSELWSDDPWYADQENREFIPNPGYEMLHEGEARGTILGGNLCTFNLLQGTPYMPPLKDSILFLEDDETAGAYTDADFDRNLQSVIHCDGFEDVRGLVIGRFQKNSKMTTEKIRKIVASKRELKSLPVVCGADFGHTDPYITFPIGGTAELRAFAGRVSLRIDRH